MLRLLCDLGVFTEVRDGVFANNSLSTALTDDEHFRAFVITLYVSNSSIDSRLGLDYHERLSELIIRHVLYLAD